MKKNARLQDYIKALSATEQIWQTVMDTPLMDVIAQILEDGFWATMEELSKDEQQGFSKSLCTVAGTLMELNLRTKDEHRLLINAIQPNDMTAFPSSWLSLRPWYPRISEISDEGFKDDDVTLLESLALLMGSEIVYRLDQAIRSPDPEGDKKSDMGAVLEQARKDIDSWNLMSALPNLSLVLKWLLEGNDPSIGQPLTIPDGELKQQIPDDLLTSCKTIVQHINRMLRTGILNQITIKDIVYATYPTRGGVFMKGKKDHSYHEIFKPGETPLFKTPEQFRRWIGNKMGVKGRRSSIDWGTQEQEAMHE